MKKKKSNWKSMFWKKSVDLNVIKNDWLFDLTITFSILITATLQLTMVLSFTKVLLEKMINFGYDKLFTLLISLLKKKNFVYFFSLSWNIVVLVLLLIWSNVSLFSIKRNLFYFEWNFNFIATKGQSLKEEWIAYICREILRVRKLNFNN